MSVITETKPITDNMTNKEKLILDNFRELARLKREIFKPQMGVILCNINATPDTSNLRSLNVLYVQSVQ
jgi:hypothetical protein